MASYKDIPGNSIFYAIPCQYDVKRSCFCESPFHLCAEINHLCFSTFHAPNGHSGTVCVYFDFNTEKLQIEKQFTCFYENLQTFLFTNNSV